MESNPLSSVNPSGLTKHELKSIWSMAKAAFASNKDHLIIPSFVAERLTENQLLELKTNFSSHFGNVNIMTFTDEASELYHICKAPEATASPDNPTTVSSSADSPGLSFDSASSTIHPSGFAGTGHTKAPARPVKQLRLPGKKARVPRPPNAFILYRKDHHPALKAVQPDLPNNAISVILGKQWNQENEETKDRYKTMADIIKAQHARANPGYQYSPRKPSEKKRRMTAKKRARLNAANTDSDALSNSDYEMSDVIGNFDHEFSGSMPSDTSENMVNENVQFSTIGSTNESADAGGYAGLRLVEHDEYSDDMTLKVPTGHKFVEMDYNSLIRSLYTTMASQSEPGLSNEITCSTPAPVRATYAELHASPAWEEFEADRKFVEASLAAPTNEATEVLNTEVFDTEVEQQVWRAEFDKILWMFD
ncbi:hypothetical protein H2204_011970 [Knufia peltigerae]|uniref:HMG box domain-containing protein n=1 Tax=Knufia peltigerae TaxID=1002370 RepID=A0AA38XT59_9EURO|nr:hypothetical protein H2204_011970 [Knufia peltigerae]